MKQLIHFCPAFDPIAKTLDFSALPGFEITKLYAVINVTQGAVMYIPGGAGLGASVSSYSPYVITLNLNTSTFSTTDTLNVYYEVEYTNSSDMDPMLMLLGQIHEVLTHLLVEQKVQTQFLSQGFIGLPLKDDPDLIRADTAASTDADFE